jgi:hypothetical protein
MAKMLGQDLFTQDEFDEFKKNDFDRVDAAQKAAYELAGSASELARKAARFANIAIMLSVVALAVSLFTLLR